MKKSPALQNILLLILSYLCTLSVGQIVSLNGNPLVFYGGTYYGYNLSSVLIFAITFVLLKKYIQLSNKRLWIFTSLLGLLCSFLIVYGAYAHLANNIFVDAQTSLMQVGMILSLNLFIAPLLAQLFLFVNKAETWCTEQTSGKFKRLPDWGFFLLCWLVIFVAYVPLFLSQWPGNFIFDAKYQMANHITNTLSTHHPLAHTMLMGWAYDLGLRMGNASAGFQFYTLIQMLLLSGAFAYCCLYLYQKKAPKWLQICTFLWFALFPMNALFAISATKDVLFSAFFLVFFIFNIQFIVDKNHSWFVVLGIVISGVLSCLYRNNAIYAIIIASVITAVLIKAWKKKLAILIMMVCIYVFSSLATNALITIASAKEHDSYKETFSIPLQCLARVACYRGDELGSELKDEIYLYIPEVHIPNYNPYNSDPIKNYASEHLLRTNTLNFFKLWLKVGLQFPDEYVESIITNTFGYWYPLNQGVYVSAEVPLFHTLIGVGEEIVKQDYCTWANKLYFSFYSMEYRQIPILAFFFRNAPYVWILILSLFIAWYKKNAAKFAVLLFPFFYLATCFAGPTVFLRYVYCIVVLAPIIIYITIKKQDPESK